MINSFLSHSTIITTFFHSFDSCLKKYEKIISQGKTLFQHLLNILFETKIVNEKLQKKENFNLFRKINEIDLLSLETQKISTLKKIYLKFEELINIERNMDNLLENIASIMKKIFLSNSEKAIEYQNFETKDEVEIFELFNNNTDSKLKKKVSSIIKLFHLTTVLKDEYKNNFGLLNDINEMLEKMGEKEGEVFLEEGNIKELKYYLQLWIHSPYIKEKSVENWRAEFICFISL